MISLIATTPGSYKESLAIKACVDEQVSLQDAETD